MRAGWHRKRPRPIPGVTLLNPSDGAVWALVAGAFVLGVVSTLVGVRLGRRRPNLAEHAQNGHSSRASGTASVGTARSFTPPSGPRSGSSPHSSDSQDVPRNVQALVLTAIAEQLVSGSSALILCPPDHSSAMIWHIHLDPTVALDVRDGRTIPVQAPLPTHQWRLPGGQTVQVAQGGPERAPGGETVAMRITGPYVRVTLAADQDHWRSITAITFGDPRGPSDLRADLASWTAVEAALRQAVSLALGRRAADLRPSLGYGRAAWDSHDRTWLTARSQEGRSQESGDGRPPISS